MKLIWKVLFPAFLAFLICLPAKPASKKIYSINSLFGISVREVNSICSDDRGFIWASSKNGVIRIANDDCEVYNLPVEMANVFQVHVFSHNSELYAFTNNGQVFIFDKMKDKFRLILNIANSIKDENLYVYNMIIDKYGNFWIASFKGLYKYQSGKVISIDKSLTKKHLLEYSPDGELLIVKSNGVWKIDTSNDKLQQICRNETGKEIIPFSIYFDKKASVYWIGTLLGGIFQFDINKKKIREFDNVKIPNNTVRSIESNTDSTLLFGVDGQGIWEYDKKSRKIINVYKEDEDDPYSMKGNGVYDIFCDNNKRVWVATYSGGLSYYNQVSSTVNHIVHRYNDTNSLINNDVNCTLEDSNGKIWFGTNNGISVYNRNSNKWFSLFADIDSQAKVFLSLCEDNSGQIWAGSYSSGIYIIDSNSGKLLAHYSDKNDDSPMKNNFIMDIYKDRFGDIWLGGVVGDFYCFKSNENKFISFRSQPLYCFTELDENKMFLGCSDGLSLLDKRTKNVEVLLSGVSINDMQKVDNVLWMATSGGGLYKYFINKGKAIKFTSNSGIPSNFINSLTYSEGYLWVGTEKGLFKFDIETNKIQTYTSIPQLSNSSFNRGAIQKLKNGQLICGTNKGAYMFPSELFSDIDEEGKIFFENLIVSGRSIKDCKEFNFGKPLDSLEVIKLKYYQNTINLQLIPISQMKGTKFSWKLDGLDKSWTRPSDNRTITYTNIPNGTNSLFIRLYDSSSSRIIAERKLVIKMIPPFWRTFWFWFANLIIAGLILFLLFDYYIKSLKQKHNEEKVKFFVNTAHDIRTTLTLVKAPVDELNKESGLSANGKYFLETATAQLKHLLSVFNQLMDFQKADVNKEKLSLTNIDVVNIINKRKYLFETYAISRNIKLDFHHDSDILISAIDEPKFEKILDNLLSNAIKYSNENSSVNIKLTQSDRDFEISIQDFGIGISSNAKKKLFSGYYRGENAINSKVVGTGIGLLLVKNYVDLLGGSITFSSEEKKGTTFYLTLPKRELNSDEIFINDFNKDIFSKSEIQNENQKEFKILIAEDNEELLNFLSVSLHNQFKILKAGNGNEAWSLVQKNNPDLVISDILMPGIDGFELCRKIKITYETAHIPVILLTALTDVSEEIKGLGLGADDYLTKPFDINILTKKIFSIINNRKVIREKALRIIKNSDEEQVFSNENNDKFLKRAIEISVENMSNCEFDKDHFASSMNVSPSLLYKKMKSLTGQSPNEFIKSIRLNRALDLLNSRKYSVTEVSEMCGFSSIGYFSTVFRKYFGKTPSEI